MALSNWDTAGKEEGSLYVVLLISRNKDNRNVENFTERKQSFVYHSVNQVSEDNDVSVPTLPSLPVNGQSPTSGSPVAGR